MCKMICNFTFFYKKKKRKIIILLFLLLLFHFLLFIRTLLTMINETSLCRRHSFPPQIRNDDILTEPKSNFLEEVIELGPTLLCPLTFKNLELHTKAVGTSIVFCRENG